MAVKVGGGLFVVGVIVAAIVLVPRITESKRERADRERREAAAAMAERRRELIAEQRPQRARAEAGASRTAVVAELERDILADARRRVAAGTLSGPAARRVECDAIRHGQDPDGPRVVYSCIAVTSDIPDIESAPQGVIGHPYRAVAEFQSGRLTWCKVSGRPGEGSLTLRGVRIPRACSL